MKEYRAGPGETVYFAAKNAIDFAVSSGREIEFEFNGISVWVHPDSYPGDIATIVSLKHEIRRLNWQHGIK